MQILPLSESNLKEACSVYNASVDECDNLSLDWFRFHTLDDPDFCPETTLLAVEDGRAASFAHGVRREHANGVSGFIKSFATLPEYRGRRYAKALFQVIESHLAGCGVSAVKMGCPAPRYITPGIDPRLYTPAVDFLMGRGFKYTRMAYNMDAELAGRNFCTKDAEDALKSKGIIIYRMEPEEKDLLAEFITAEGWGKNWLLEATYAMQSNPPGLFVAKKDGKIAGFAACGALRPGFFGPMGTAASMRGLGVGQILFKKCLSHMQTMGRDTCHISAVDPLRFYHKSVGAKVSRIFWEMEKPLI